MNSQITTDYAIASWTLKARLEGAQTEDERRTIQRDYDRKAELYFAALRANVGMNQ